MSLKVKICGIKRSEDAVHACGFGADLLGFNFVPGSSRYVDPYTARGIIEMLPSFVAKVGIFAGEDYPVINDMSVFLGLDAVQLHGDEDPEYCRRLNSPVIKAVRVGGPGDLVGLDGFDVSAYLLDACVEGAMGGTGRTFEWRDAVDFCAENRVFVAGGLTAENVAEAVGMLKPYGVDSASGVEKSPGIKDPDLMDKFIRAARCAAMENGNKGGCSDTAGRRT